MESKNNLDSKIFGKLPMDVIREVIMPFAYNLQPKKLLFDIRNFYEDWNIIDSYYSCHYNYIILEYDIVQFCYYITKMRNVKLIKQLISGFVGKRNSNKKNSLRFLCGLMTPKQRTRFINNHIIYDDEYY